MNFAELGDIEVTISGGEVPARSFSSICDGRRQGFPRPAELPRPIGSAVPLAKIVGNDAALTLIEAFGGVRLYVPTLPLKDNVGLVTVIGVDAAKKLADEYEGMQIKIPVAREWRAIVYRYAGRTLDEIALLLSVDRSTVFRILRDRKIPAPAARPRRRSATDQDAKNGDMNQTAKSGRLIGASEGSDDAA